MGIPQKVQFLLIHHYEVSKIASVFTTVCSVTNEVNILWLDYFLIETLKRWIDTWNGQNFIVSNIILSLNCHRSFLNDKIAVLNFFGHEDRLIEKDLKRHLSSRIENKSQMPNVNSTILLRWVGVFLKIDKTEYHADVSEGSSETVIMSISKESAPSFPTVRRWV